MVKRSPRLSDQHEYGRKNSQAETEDRIYSYLLASYRINSYLLTKMLATPEGAGQYLRRKSRTDTVTTNTKASSDVRSIFDIINDAEHVLVRQIFWLLSVF